MNVNTCMHYRHYYVLQVPVWTGVSFFPVSWGTGAAGWDRGRRMATACELGTELS